MKRLIFFTIALLCITTIYGQEIGVGAKAGVNFASLNGDFENGKARTSFHFGAVVPITLNEKFTIQPELLYSSQGADSSVDDDEVLKLNYINIPLILKYYVIDRLSLEAGPQIGFLTSAKAEFDGESEDIKDITKSIDFGLNIGAAYELDNGINFGLRYFFGSNINDIPDDSDKITNGVFQLSIGYLFKI